MLAVLSTMFMRFQRLNFGGIFGGVVCAGGAIAIVYLLSNGGVPARSFKVIAMAALGGSALGNWIWRLALPAETPPQ
jgi:hypothetical protein